MLLNLGNRGSTVAGVLTIIIFKLIIPVSMLMGTLKFTLNYKYAWSHWLGALTLLIGVATTGANDFQNALPQGFSGAIGNMILIVLSVFPLAAAFIFIEKYLKKCLLRIKLKQQNLLQLKKLNLIIKD